MDVNRFSELDERHYLGRIARALEQLAVIATVRLKNDCGNAYPIPDFDVEG